MRRLPTGLAQILFPSRSAPREALRKIDGSVIKNDTLTASIQFSRPIEVASRLGLSLSIGKKIAIAVVLVATPFAFLTWQVVETSQGAIDRVARARDGVLYLQAISEARRQIDSYQSLQPALARDMLDEAIDFLHEGQAGNYGNDAETAALERRAEALIRGITEENRDASTIEATNVLSELARVVAERLVHSYGDLPSSQDAAAFILRRTPVIRRELRALERHFPPQSQASSVTMGDISTARLTLERALLILGDAAEADGASTPIGQSLAGPLSVSRQSLTALSTILMSSRLALESADVGANEWRDAFLALDALEHSARVNLAQRLHDRTGELQHQRLHTLFWAWAFLVASLAGVGVSLHRSVVRPVKELAETARTLAGGEYSAEIPQQSRVDEMGQIARFLSHYRDLVESRTRAEVMCASAKSADLAKSQFIAGMSHELRTPLNAIIGYSELVIEEAGCRLQASETKDLERVLANARHLLALINDILDISKVEAGRVDLLIEEFDASALLLEAAETVAPIAAKNGTRIVVVPSGVKRPCRTDIFKLRQCLLNLMSNACKFTRGGEIRLSVEECDMAGSRTLRFRIADTGIGMTPEQVGRLFHAFVQADPSITREFGGTGLGLVLTRQIARLLGGDVSVISAKDVGSTFTLWVTHQAISSPNDALSTTSVSAADAPIVAMSLANRADITELAATKTTSELRALGAAA